MRALEPVVVKSKEAFDCFFGGLLAMLDGSVQVAIRESANLAGGIEVVARLDEPGADQFSLGAVHR